MNKKMPLTVVVKPTKNCNLKCKYCYEEKNNDGIMNESTLERMISEVLRYNHDVCKEQDIPYTAEFIWHGGEPLLMGKKFYETVKQLQNKYVKIYGNCLIKNDIQTNLTLLTPELWKFFEAENFSMGFSLDGCKEMNDCNRVYKNGAGTYEIIRRAVEITRDNHLENAPIGAIAVLTKERLEQIPQLYQFFKESRINFDLSGVFIQGNATGYHNDMEITPLEWGTAMKQLFDLWFDDNTEPKIEIANLVKFAAGIIKGDNNSCIFSGNCREFYLSVNPNGDAYPCGRFGAEDKFKLGNTTSDSIEKIFASDVQKYLVSRNVETIEDCQACDYKKMCQGGCLHNACRGGNVLGKDPLCEGYKLLFDHIKVRLTERLTQKLVEQEK